MSAHLNLIVLLRLSSHSVLHRNVPIIHLVRNVSVHRFLANSIVHLITNCVHCIMRGLCDGFPLAICM